MGKRIGTCGSCSSGVQRVKESYTEKAAYKYRPQGDRGVTESD